MPLIATRRPAEAYELRDGLPERLLRLTSHHSSAGRLGAAYLAAADRDRLALTARRLRDLGSIDQPGLRLAIAELAREDLACGDTVLVDGWVLARAEAEVLALIYSCEGRRCWRT